MVGKLVYFFMLICYGNINVVLKQNNLKSLGARKPKVIKRISKIG